MPRTVFILIMIIAAATIWLVIHYWDVLSVREEPTAIVRNVALVAGGLMAGIIALWRGAIAAQQVTVARQEQYHLRFQKACESFSARGIENSHTRRSGIFAFVHLVNDHPDLAFDVHEVLLTFLFQASPRDHDPGEFLAVQLAAEKTCDKIEEVRFLEKHELHEMRSAICVGVDRAAARMSAVGVTPPGIPVEK